MSNLALIQMLANANGPAMAYPDEKTVRRAISEQNAAYRNLCNLPDSGAYAPMGESPILYENGFAVSAAADGRPRPTPPAGDALFRDCGNTNAIFTSFIGFMKENGLLRQ